IVAEAPGPVGGKMRPLRQPSKRVPHLMSVRQKKRLLLLAATVTTVVAASLVMLAVAGLPSWPMRSARTVAGTPALDTPWGEPDLQGIWSREVDIPLERPARYANQEFLSDDQRAELDRQIAEIIRRDSTESRRAPGTERDVNSEFSQEAFRSEPGVPLGRPARRARSADRRDHPPRQHREPPRAGHRARRQQRIQPGSVHGAPARRQAHLAHRRSAGRENAAAHAGGSEGEGRISPVPARASPAHGSLQGQAAWLRRRKIRTRLAATKRRAAALRGRHRGGDQPRERSG